MSKSSANYGSLRVLVATDNIGVGECWMLGYREIGVQAVVGARNLQLSNASFDIIHINWPEELVGWHPPSGADLDVLERRLASWRERSSIVFSVNNVRPHFAEADDASKDVALRLYECVIRNCDLITHFSNFSLEEFKSVYPSASETRNIVHGFGGYKHLPNASNSLAVRSMRRTASDFRLLVIGQIRSAAETSLLMKGISAANVRNKAINYSGTLVWGSSGLKERAQRYQWKLWLMSRGASTKDRFVPDAELGRLFAESDALVVPRISNLSSALPLLGASFSIPVVAPSIPALREYLDSTKNLFYRAGDGADLARAIEECAAADRSEIERVNYEVSQKWSWGGVCATILDAARQASAARMSKVAVG